MGILDDAIREHLDLKRKHGARDSEISEIEDEALGSGDRPDPFAAGELFGGVSSSASPRQGAPAQELERPTPPPAGPPTPPPSGRDETPPAEEPTALIEQPSAPPEPPAPEPPAPEPPRAEPPEPSFPEPPPAEPESPSAPEPPAESESLEELMAEEEPSPPKDADLAVPPPPPPETEGAARPGGEPAIPVEPSEPLPEPTDERRAEAAEFESGPEPPPPPPPAATEGQRGRARGRADVPTQEHIPPREETGDVPPVPSESAPPPEEGAPQLYDFETDPGLLDEDAGAADLEPAPRPPADSDDFEALGPVDEGEEAVEVGDDLYPVEEEPHGEQRGGTTDFEEADAVDEDPGTEVRPPAPPEEDEEGYRTEVRPADPDEEEEDDLLSESPEFLDKDTDDSLWFEKGPPKDFDFEDDED
jgi:hypothetical protein